MVFGKNSMLQRFDEFSDCVFSRVKTWFKRKDFTWYHETFHQFVFFTIHFRHSICHFYVEFQIEDSHLLWTLSFLIMKIMFHNLYLSMFIKNASIFLWFFIFANNLWIDLLSILFCYSRWDWENGTRQGHLRWVKKFPDNTAVYKIGIFWTILAIFMFKYS